MHCRQLGGAFGKTYILIKLNEICRWNPKIKNFSRTPITNRSRFGHDARCQRDYIELELAAVDKEFREKENKLSRATKVHQVKLSAHLSGVIY